MSSANTEPRDGPTVALDSAARQRVFLWLVTATILTGTIVRLVMYVSATPQYDESFTHLNFATVPLGDAASSYFTPGNHILYSILANISQMALDGGILVTRLPALIAGILVIPAVIYFTNEVTDSRRISLIAGILAAFNPQLIMYSAEARGYTMLALFAVIWAILGYRIATSDHIPIRRWVGLALVSALGIWTIPVFVYALVGLASWMVVLRAISKGLTWRFIGISLLAGVGAGILTLIAYTPAIAREGLSNIVNNPYLTTTNPDLGGVPDRAFSSFFELAPGYLGSVSLWMVEAIPTVVSVLLAAAVIIGILSPRTPFAIRLLVPVFTAGFIVALALHRLQPLARSWAPLLPLLIVTAAAGFGALRPIRLAEPTNVVVGVAALALIVGTVGLASVAADYEGPMRDVAAADMEQVVALMEERYPEGATLVVTRSTWPQAQYWLSRFPDIPYGGPVRLVVIDHRLPFTLEDLSDRERMRHMVTRTENEPGYRAGATTENLVPIAEFGSSTVYEKTG